jgi:hypothetical protein
LFPFQNIALNIGTTIFDIFPLLMGGVIVFHLLFRLFGLEKFHLNYRSLGFIIWGFFYLFFYIFFHPQPIFRFISAFFWLLILVGVFIILCKYESSHLWNNFMIMCVLVAISVYIQYFFWGIERPNSFFKEPSTAGLLLFSVSFYYLLNLFKSEKKKLFNFLFLLFFLGSSFLTKSSHFFVFILFSIFLIPTLINKDRILKVFYILLTISVFLIPYFDLEYYFSKFNFSDLENLNISQLSWLRGFEQAISVIKVSPIFGLGLGSTGYIDFLSNYSERLEFHDLGDINLYDAYSLFLRLVIEIGLLQVALLVIYFFRPFLKVVTKRNNKDFGTKSVSERYYVIGIFLLAGSFLKEPNYGVSLIFISILFLGIYFNYTIKHSNDNSIGS